MDAKVKKCKQCGKFKNLDEFRTYYNKNKNKPPGRYTICKFCESVNQRWKYLSSKIKDNTASEQDLKDYNEIEELYDILRQRGLEPPRRKASTIASDLSMSIKELMAESEKDLERREEAGLELDTPDELVEWSTKDLQGYHPDELEKVSDRLWETYYQQIGVDPETYEAIRDTTWLETLTRIQERFDEHNDNYWRAHDE